MKQSGKIQITLLKNLPFIILIVLFVVTGIMEPKFFSWSNIENILLSSSYIGVLAVGMTFVLLTGGIDLSVGSTMYMTASFTGLMIAGGIPTIVAVIIALLIAVGIGALNGIIITKLKLIPFLATMAMMTLLRGVALVFTKSILVKLPEELSGLGSVKLFEVISVPVLIFIAIIIIATLFLSKTSTGKQIYAVGNNEDYAVLAGIKKDRVKMICYIICGLLAGVSGLLAVTQYGVVNAGFGQGVEFNAIAAAVLGGISLSGGIGKVFPGTLIGTVLIQLIQVALVYLKVDLYITPIISALIILLAVMMDSYRYALQSKLERRHICKVEE